VSSFSSRRSLRTLVAACVAKERVELGGGEDLRVCLDEVTSEGFRGALDRPCPQQAEEKSEREASTTALGLLVRCPEHAAAVRREVLAESVVDRDVQLCAPELPIAILPVAGSRLMERHNAPVVFRVGDTRPIVE